MMHELANFKNILSCFWTPGIKLGGIFKYKLQPAGILHCVDQHIITWGTEKLPKMNYYYDLRSCEELHSGNWFIIDFSVQRIGSNVN